MSARVGEKQLNLCRHTYSMLSDVGAVVDVFAHDIHMSNTSITAMAMTYPRLLVQYIPPFNYMNSWITLTPRENISWGLALCCTT